MEVNEATKECRYYQVQKGKKKPVKGVELSESIYYWWFEYLKLSDKYQRLCGLDVQLTSCDESEYELWLKQYGRELFDDFGDIYQYENGEGFWRWWNERGQWIFGIKPIHSLDEFSSVEDVLEHRELIESGAVKLVALPTSLSQATLQRRLAKLVSKLELSGTQEQRAPYHPHNVKVDVESLRTAFQAYKLRQEGKSNVYIGAYFSLCIEQQREFVRDGRQKGETFDFEAYRNFVTKRELVISGDEQADKKKLELEAQAIEDGHIVFYMDGDRRTAKKNYLNVKASRMVAKADENIRGVEEKRFPVGTPKRLVVGKSNEKKS
jgi:hypothetical protein